MTSHSEVQSSFTLLWPVNPIDFKLRLRRWRSCKGTSLAATGVMGSDASSRRAPVGMEFVRIELALGFAFVNVATSANGDTDQRNRYRDHAQRAHDHCAAALSRLTLNTRETTALSRDILRLQLTINAIPI